MCTKNRWFVFKENDIYYKPVDEKDLSDIYAVEFYVFLTQALKMCLHGGK